MKSHIYENYETICRAIAAEIIMLVTKKPMAVLGLARGKGPEGVYNEIIRLFKQEKDASEQDSRPMRFSFSKVTFFALGEFVNLNHDHPEAMQNYLHKKLFKHIDADPKKINLPDGMRHNMAEACRDYEKALKKAGGIDFQIMDFEGSGHIAFNEPDSGVGTRTRVVRLTDEVRKAQAEIFGSKVDKVPEFAITVGAGTIFKRVRRIGLIVVGQDKIAMVEEMLRGKSKFKLPAFMIQRFPSIQLYIEKRAA